jgi:2-polyprenyl-3-methyl-5-hydroxy-6-metoxy-1,4-benzoquinol methylase
MDSQTASNHVSLHDELNSYFEKARHEMLPLVPVDAHIILEVGCGKGCFGKLLKQMRTVEIWGVEPNAQAAETASSTLDRVISSGFDSSLNLPEQKFDCIIFNDVLEHLSDPFSALEYCKKLLRPQGVIVASIPNVRYFENIWNLLINKDWHYTDWGILDRTHLRFFTCRSIKSTFNELGFSVKYIQGINPIQSRKFDAINLLFMNQVNDMRYMQFAIVARPT